MSVIARLPSGTFFRPCAAIFEADYNTPTAGLYDFGVAANESVSFLELNPSHLYFLSILNFSANVPVSAYLENIETIPNLDLRLSLGGAQLYQQGYPLVSYLDNNEISIFFWTDRKGDTLIGNFNGTLSQNASLSGIASIIAQAALNIHEITDHKYIAEFKGQTKQNGGNNFTQLPQSMRERI